MPTVLITGASRGIGRAATKRMAEKGWTVLAGVRSDEDGEKLTAELPSVRPVRLDVTSPADIAALPGLVADGLDAVVNNAGQVIDGPIETVPPDRIRAGFEVNVVGTIAVTQAVLPALRLRRGRVVLVSSVSGLVSTPLTGVYNATKFALEALGDAWRIELRPWRIPVVLVEPGATSTDIWTNMLDNHAKALESLSPEHRALYEPQFVGMGKTMAMMRKRTVPADNVAKAIQRALTARRPKARYLVGVSSHAQVAAIRLTPTPIVDAMTARVAGARP